MPKENDISVKVSALVEKNKQLLLIKEKIDDRGHKWNVVKGTFDPQKDADLESALKRELKEEAGIDQFQIHGITNSFVVRREGSVTVQVNFSVTTDQDIEVGSNSIEDDEDIVGLKLFSKEKLVLLKKEDFLTERAWMLVNEWMRIN